MQNNGTILNVDIGTWRISLVRSGAAALEMPITSFMKGFLDAKLEEYLGERGVVVFDDQAVRRT